MSARVEDDPEFRSIPPKPSPRRSCSLGSLLMGVVILAALVALFLPATRSAGPAARRSQCGNNLKQIALALHNYQQAYEAFPPAYTVDAAGRPLHSWRTLILPYLESGSLYAKIDLTKPWDDPANAAAAASRPSVYICPSADDAKNTTTYLALVGPGRFLASDRPRRLEEITDGLASTLAVIEAGDADAVPWMAPRDADAALVMSLGTNAELHHADGTNAALADGSAKFLKADTPAPMWRALLSISGDDGHAINFR